MMKTDNEKDKAEASGKKTTTDTSAAKSIPFALLAVGAVLAESAKIVAEDTAKAYLLERLPTKSGALKTTLEKSLEAK